MSHSARKADRAPTWRFVAPNLITAMNMMLGAASLLCTLSGRYTWGAWLVMLGVLLDKLDGTTARLLGAASKFGVEFDSLADLTTFGIAPAALIFAVVAGHQPPIADWRVTVLALSCAAYVLASAVRLARFNVDASAGGTKVYFGMTMPVSAAMLVTVLLLMMKYGREGYQVWLWDPKLLGGWATPHWAFEWYFLLVLFVAGLMVSGLRVPKPRLTRSLLVNAYLVGNTIAVYTVIPLHMFPEYLVFAAWQWLVVSCAYSLTAQGRVQSRMSLAETLRLPPDGG